MIRYFGCHSVCLSSGEVTFRSSDVNITCSTATSFSPLMRKVVFYCIHARYSKKVKPFLSYESYIADCSLW